MTFLSGISLSEHRKKFIYLSLVFVILCSNLVFFPQSIVNHHTLMPDKTNELIKKAKELKLEPGRTVFIPRLFRRDSYLQFKLGWFNSDHLEVVKDDNSYVFMRIVERNPWNLVRREKIFARKNLKFVIYAHGKSIEKFSKQQLKYLSIPPDLLKGFKKIWQNEAGTIYEREEKF